MTVNSGPRARHIDIVFTKEPGHDHAELVEVEDDLGRGIRFGNWVQRPDGYWVIRITPEDVAHWFGRIGDEKEQQFFPAAGTQVKATEGERP